MAVKAAVVLEPEVAIEPARPPLPVQLFAFSDDQVLLAATTRRFLDDHESLAQVRLRLEGPDPFDPGVWEQGAALGWSAMLVPEEPRSGEADRSQCGSSHRSQDHAIVLLIRAKDHQCLLIG